MKNYATQNQRDEIKRLGARYFDGDIDSEAFLVFSPWLMKEFGYFHLDDIPQTGAGLVIEKLKKLIAGTPTQPHKNAPKRDNLCECEKMVELAAKMFLRGVEAGKAHPDKKSPTIEKIKAKIAQEMQT